MKCLFATALAIKLSVIVVTTGESKNRWVGDAARLAGHRVSPSGTRGKEDGYPPTSDEILRAHGRNDELRVETKDSAQRTWSSSGWHVAAIQ